MAFSIELGLILLFSILGGVLAVRFKQPSVLGLLLVGAIVGPNTLGLIKDTSLINSAIEIGAILLLFTLGIEFSLQHLLRLGLRVIIIAVTKLGAVFLFSYYASLLLGLDFITSLYIGVILSITSTVIVVKILEQKGMSKREELPLLVAVLIMEDVFGVFALTFFSSLNAKVDLAPLNLFAKLLISLTLMVIAYSIIQRILKPLIKWLIKYSAEDTITFISIGLCGGMSFLAYLFNLSPSVGAFLAGNIVASLPNSKIFEKAIHPFILTFTSLFFFSIGTIVNFSSVLNSIYLILILLLVSLLSKFLSIGFGSYLFTNFDGRRAIFSGIAMLSVGEFSLLIAKESAAVVTGIDLVSITAAIIVLSSIAMSILINYTDKIYGLTAKYVPAGVKENMNLTSKFINSISWSMLKDKVSARKMLFEWKTILNNLIVILFISTTGFFLWRYFKDIYVIIIFVLIVLFFPSLRIAKNASDLLKNSLKFFVKLYPSEIANEKMIFRNLIFTALLFLLIIIFPTIFLFVHMKPIHNIVILFLFIVLVVSAFRVSSLIHVLIKRHESKFNLFSKKYKLVLLKRMKSTKLKPKNEQGQN